MLGKQETNAPSVEGFLLNDKVSTESSRAVKTTLSVKSF